ncbi:hypothetical protein PQQ99_13200 [Paraburkholderia sediminicola]|uniref:DUF7673 family protein n=1 Tax=Paraburkholderia sediminicola TaxID=458836 RepID=UPI0038BA9514
MHHNHFSFEEDTMTIEQPAKNAPDVVHTAITRLLSKARVPTDQGEHVARFLLSWWNSDEWGGFSPLTLRSVDTALAEAMLTILTHVSHRGGYPDDYGYNQEFAQLCRQWIHLRGESEAEEQKKMRLVATVMHVERRNRELAKIYGPRRKIDLRGMPPPKPLNSP